MTRLFSVLIALALTLNLRAQPPSAEVIIRDATEIAARENKNVFIIFTASWCGWCKRMDASLSDSSCRSFFEDNYVIRHLVVDESKDKQALENSGARELRTKYYGDGQGIPYWMIFDKDGNLIADSKIRNPGAGLEKGSNTGCPASEQEVNYFIKVLKKTSALKDDQLEIIRKRFRRNEI